MTPTELDTLEQHPDAAAVPALCAALREAWGDRNTLRAEVARLRAILGRADPVRCPSCGEVRERAEGYCGNCTSPLDPDEAAKWSAEPWPSDGFPESFTAQIIHNPEDV